MLAEVSGTQDGKDWPARGESVRVEESEAGLLIAAGIAATPPELEVATVSAPEDATAALSEDATVTAPESAAEIQ